MKITMYFPPDLPTYPDPVTYFAEVSESVYRQIIEQRASADHVSTMTAPMTTDPNEPLVERRFSPTKPSVITLGWQP